MMEDGEGHNGLFLHNNLQEEKSSKMSSNPPIAHNCICALPSIVCALLALADSTILGWIDNTAGLMDLGTIKSNFIKNMSTECWGYYSGFAMEAIALQASLSKMAVISSFMPFIGR